MEKALTVSDFHTLINTSKKLVEIGETLIAYIKKQIEKNPIGFLKIIDSTTYSFTFECMYYQYTVSILIEPEFLSKTRNGRIVTHCISARSYPASLKQPILLPGLTTEFDDIGNIQMPDFFADNIRWVPESEYLGFYLIAFVNAWKTHNFPISHVELEKSKP